MSISILPHANDNDSANDDGDDADYVNDYYKKNDENGKWPG